VLLIHAGIADSRMWHPQVPALEAAGFRVLAPDLRGFGDHRLAPERFSYVADMAALLGAPCAVVGCSLGGRVALELAVHRPDLVERLAVIAPGLPGWAWSEETRDGWAEEEAAFDRGDFDGAADVCLRMWLDRPGRAADELDPGVRALVRSMVLRSYEMQAGAWEAGAHEDDAPGAPVTERLAEIACPTLVLVGEHDIAEMHAIASHVAGAVDGAERVVIPQAAHLPSLEHPAAVDAHLLGFLEGGSAP
jgi:pimeloyl-ACP methyl ester carboxylesterase